MKEITLEINGKEYKVKVQEFGAEKAKLSVNGTEYTVGLKDLGEPKALDIRPAAPPLKRQPAPAAKEGEPLMVMVYIFHRMYPSCNARFLSWRKWTDIFS